MLALDTPVQYVKGVGPRLAGLLAEKGITTVQDLLYYLPFRYEDRVNPRRVDELQSGEMASLVAEVRTSGLFRTARSHTPIFQMTVADPGGRVPLKCLFFHGTYLKDKFAPGQMLALYGKVEEDSYSRGPHSGTLHSFSRPTPGLGTALRATGTLQMINPQIEILPPEAEPGAAESLEIGRIVPIYEAVGRGRLTSRWFRRVLHAVLENLSGDLPEALPAAMRARLELISLREALNKVHWPDPGESFAELQRARTPAHRRLIFEELFFLELGLELKRRRAKLQPGIAFAIGERERAAIRKVLPFHPTAAQKRGLKEIAADMARPAPMRRLLQGDVGSGKTIVAFEAAIIAIENGYQVALMAPTEILAQQHYLSARRTLEKAGYRIVLLTGSVEEDRKRDLRRHIQRGDAQLVIGTHALLEQTVEFSHLGLVIVDEQHRFGVMQRFKLMKKPMEQSSQSSATVLSTAAAAARVNPGGLDGGDGRTTGTKVEAPGAEPPALPAASGASAASVLEPDVLVMTATPIPRTLALTLYGDLDVSVIDELPPGRAPVTTRRVDDDRMAEVWELVRQQVRAGLQAYVVYPVIEEQTEPGALGKPDFEPVGLKSGGQDTDPQSESAARARSGPAKPATSRAKQPSLWSGLKAAVQMYDELRQTVFPELRIGLLHGRLDADEKEAVMRRFHRGEIQVLVATTVIEVGVDVPNANVMVIEHADRFGLSQLHQLRGRIGRGAAKSHCILTTSGKLTPEAALRLDAMVRTTNGFEIAERDLELRGPGEFFGTRQAGLPDLRVANLVRDRDLLQTAKAEAALVAAGPGNQISEEEIMRAIAHLRSHWQRQYGLVEVG